MKRTPKNIFIDLNIILDVFLQRDGFAAARDVIRLGELTEHQLFISAHMVTTFGYLLEREKVPRQIILKHIDWLLQTFNVIPTDTNCLKAATKSAILDYEDAVIEQSALSVEAKAIITKNIKDFRQSIVPAQTPNQYLFGP